MEEQGETACKGEEGSNQRDRSHNAGLSPIRPQAEQFEEQPLLSSDDMPDTENIDCKGSVHVLDYEQSRSPPSDVIVAEATLAEGEPLLKSRKEDCTNSEVEDLDTFNLIEPPPLDWRSDSSSDTASVGGMDDSSLLQPDMRDTPDDRLSEPSLTFDPSASEPRSDLDVDQDTEEEAGDSTEEHEGEEEEDELQGCREFSPVGRGSPPLVTDNSMGQPAVEEHKGTGLLFSESNQRDLLGLLEDETEAVPPLKASPARYTSQSGGVDAVVSVTYSQEDGERFWDRFANGRMGDSEDITSPEDQLMEPVWVKRDGESPSEEDAAAAEISDEGAEIHSTYKDVPGPCDPEDLLDGVIFGAKYLGSTQLMSEKNPSTNARMAQAQEAVDRIKAPEGESQPMTEVDLFISTQRIKVLSADTQEAMMDHSLQMISYIADIGSIIVLMARRKLIGRKGAEGANSTTPQKKCCMICHVFSSEDAQVIAQAIGQAFGVAYRQFLQVNGIKATELRPGEYSDFLGTQEQYNGDLVHFSCSENIREVCITKAAGEILGLAVVESGWGSILPTVVVANLLHGGPAERCGELSIGDRIMSVNGTSLVGLPIATCQGIIRDLKSQSEVKLRIVHCPPVTMAIIKRPDPKYQLGFSVEDGIICSLMRGGIAERGGIRVGHRIIEINGQSVVATSHEKIIHILTHAVGEIHLKTMPVSTYRLLTGQEQPVFL
ncbi:hypothetical protein GJAV_G00075110 [Gymnothorax javanicus]|nr:hypothetical protein GJAV_G00075110 [Gymnothorax javanicus]